MRNGDRVSTPARRRSCRTLRAWRILVEAPRSVVARSRLVKDAAGALTQAVWIECVISRPVASKFTVFGVHERGFYVRIAANEVAERRVDRRRALVARTSSVLRVRPLCVRICARRLLHSGVGATAAATGYQRLQRETRERSAERAPSSRPGERMGVRGQRARDGRGRGRCERCGRGMREDDGGLERVGRT